MELGFLRFFAIVYILDLVKVDVGREIRVQNFW
jgi:hypothetical protein